MLHLLLAHSALHPQHDLLGYLGSLMKHRLGLSTKPTLLSVVTPLTLCKYAILPLLVLRHLLQGVLPAELAVGLVGLGNVHLYSVSCARLRCATYHLQSLSTLLTRWQI